MSNYDRWHRWAMQEARERFGADAVKEVSEDGRVFLFGGASTPPNCVVRYDPNKCFHDGYVTDHPKAPGQPYCPRCRETFTI